ncbi:MAG: ferrous iron transport protein A [Oscillospiraceae bacterium]|nr:ferrous iron transport protein A [Oscillospiraceae bacterium]
MTLKDLKVGQSGRVKSVGGEKALRRRLLDMGITPRTFITVKKAAPMGDPIELLLRGYVLSLRLDDAQSIEIATESEIKKPKDSEDLKSYDLCACGKSKLR